MLEFSSVMLLAPSPYPLDYIEIVDNYMASQEYMVKVLCISTYLFLEVCGTACSLLDGQTTLEHCC